MLEQVYYSTSWLTNIPLNGQITFCLFSLADGHLNCFYLLDTRNTAAKNVCVQCSPFSRSIPMSAIAGANVTSMLKFFRNYHAAFYNSYALSHFHQQAV